MVHLPHGQLNQARQFLLFVGWPKLLRHFGLSQGKAARQDLGIMDARETQHRNRRIIWLLFSWLVKKNISEYDSHFTEVCANNKSAIFWG